MKFIKSLVPNTLTSLNLFFGLVGIVLSFNYGLTEAFYCILIAAVFDFLDGLASRLLKVKSEFGGELDSLADMVTFGALPGFMLFHYISIAQGNYLVPVYERETNEFLLNLLGFLVPVFSALRLAKFNVDTNQNDNFLGLPTPANAIFIGSLGFIMEIQFHLNYYQPLTQDQLAAVSKIYYWDSFDFYTVTGFFSPAFHIVLAIVSSALLVSRIPLFSLKLKNLKYVDNKLVFNFFILIAGIILLNFLPYFVRIYRWISFWVTLDFLIIPLAIVLYIIVSLIGYRNLKNEV